MAKMRKIKVGSIMPEMKRYTGGAIFDTAANQMRLVVCLKNPSSQQMYDVRKGNFEIALFAPADCSTIFITAKFGDNFIVGYPYNASVGDDIDPRKFGNLLQIILVDPSTGEIKVLRAIGLAQEFARAIGGYAAEQLSKPISSEQYNAEATVQIGKYSTQQMFEASHIKCSIADGKAVCDIKEIAAETEN